MTNGPAGETPAGPRFSGLMYQTHQARGHELIAPSVNDVQFSPIRFLRWAGRRVMMDFGFGTFLDKFEKRFGGALTTGLLVLIGLAVASFSLNLVATFIVIPTISLIYDVVASDRFGSYQALKTFQVLLNIFLFTAVYIVFRTAWESVRDRKEAERMADEYEAFREFAMEFWKETGGFYQEIEAALLNIERSRTKREKELAFSEARSILNASRSEYSRRVEEFNYSIEKSDYFRSSRLLHASPKAMSSDQSPEDTAAETRP